MAKLFETDEKNIRGVLGNQDSFYEIPDYQRPYSWGDDEVEELWDDMFEAWKSKDNKKNGYFLGSLVLTESAAGERYDVIDGQQRLVTLIILLCVLRDMFVAQKIDDKTIKIKRIEELISNDDKDRVTLKAQDSENALFHKEIIDKINLDGPRLSKKDKTQKKFLNTAQIFQNKIEGFEDKTKLKDFINYILDNVNVVIITCKNMETAIQIFQTLNAKGLDLSISDLIKSYLFNCIRKEDRSTLKTDWTRLEDMVNDLDVSLENLLLYYSYFLYKNDIPKGLYESLMDKKKSPFYEQSQNNAMAALHELKEFVECYKELRNSNYNSVNSLIYLRHQIYWRTMLTSAFYMNEKRKSKMDWKKLADSIKRFYYLYWIAGLTISSIKQTSFNVIKYISEGDKTIEYINNTLEEKLTNDNIITKVWDSLRYENIYNTKWIKPLLLTVDMGRYDSNLQLLLQDDNRKIHIEHILPFNHKKHSKAWEGITDKEKIINRLGNLTLLSGSKNIKASDKPFNEKLKINYLNDEGKGEDGITGFGITTHLTKYEKKGWNDTTYLDRKKWIEGEISRILRIPIPEEEL